MDFSVNVDEAASEYKAGFEVIPPGIYNVVIVETLCKPTKSGKGEVLELKCELQDGSKRHVTDRLNVVNQNETAQKIARAALGKIAQSIGHKGILTKADILAGKLNGRPFAVKIVIDEFESTAEKGKMLKSNKVAEYFEKGAAPTTAASTSGGVKPAW